jgi:hypothetical protein
LNRRIVGAPRFLNKVECGLVGFISKFKL